MVFGATALFLLLVVICRSCGQLADSQEVEKLVRQWAPLVWMSPTERYLPLSAEEFLDNVYIVDKNGNIDYSSWGSSKKNSKLSYLVTYRSLDQLRNDTTSFLHGRNPNLYPVPIYAVLTRCPARKSHHDDKKTPRGNNINAIYDMENLFYFHVSYWIFYPYNEGKDICFLGRVPTPRLFNTCLGKPKTMGNHVGDWEHMSLLFNGKRVPDKMYLAVHNTGVYYNYDQTGRYFKFEGQTTGKNNRVPKFPQIVRTQGDHPVVFAAHGSHGLWASPGEHDYHRVPRLTDKNGYGIPWKTWNNIKIYNLGHSILPSWMTFKGRWGNPKSNCLLFQKLGICEHVDGPHGILRNKQDFYCW